MFCSEFYRITGSNVVVLVFTGGGMGNTARSTVTDYAITDAQRECLSHQLRNAEAALHSTVEHVENKSSNPSLESLLSIVSSLKLKIDRLHSALSSGSFCCLTSEQCQYVSKFVGCKGIPK